MIQNDTFNSRFFSNIKNVKKLIGKVFCVVNKNSPKNVIAYGASAKIIKKVI
tara:strand:- start:243 stop:398 length:156 start_codon:yes stop_codon:yes gene_type:complete